MSDLSEIEISPPMSVQERESLYYDRVLKQDFYGSDYVKDYKWEEDQLSHVVKADAIARYFRPLSAVDCGCARGGLVGDLRQRGVSAFGMDFSQTFVALAPAEAKPFLCSADIRRLPYRDKAFEMVVCSEVLEHLPISVIDEVLQEFRRICHGPMFVTTPSHGPNIEGRYGFPMHHVPGWVEDAKLNRSFRHLPVFKKSGMPHCGHITLATHRWWRDKFAQHGLNRAVPLEIQVNYDPEIGLSGWPFCILILYEVNGSKLEMGPEDARQLGAGWHHLEQWDDAGYVRWTRLESECMLVAESGQVRLHLEALGAPPERVYPTRVECFAEQLGGDPDVLAWQQKGHFEFLLEAGRWQVVASAPFEVDPARVVRIRLRAERTWNPQQMFNSSFWGERSQDARDLGIAVKKLALE